MKMLILLVFLIALSACNSQTGVYNSLTQAEKDYLATKATQKCLADSARDFDGFVHSSDAAFTTFARERFWKHTFTLPTGTGADTVKVWKVDSNAADKVIYLVQRNVTANTTKFIKITESMNDEMIANIKTMKCSNDLTKVVKNSSSNASIIITGPIVFVDTLTDRRNVDTYNVKFNDLAYLGVMNDNLSQQTIVHSNGSISASNPFTETIDPQTFSDTPAMPVSYTSFGGLSFCVPASTGTTPNRVFAFPFTLTCSTTATPDFDPTTEL